MNNIDATTDHEDETGALSDYLDRIRPELELRLINNEKIFIDQGVYIDFSDVLDEVGGGYYKAQAAMNAFPTGGKLWEIAMRIKAIEIGKAVNIVIDRNIDQYLRWENKLKLTGELQ